MRDSLPLVSVIIPVFNCRYLGDAVHSVMEQTYPFLEIIVVDDGSTDGSAEAAARLEKVKLLRTENRGVAAARNAGLRNCSGDFISFIDADDLWLKDKTAEQVAFLASHHEVDAVHGRFRNFFEKGAAMPPWVEREKFLDPGAGKLISLGTLLIRKKAAALAGWFDETFRAGEDLDWFARFVDKGIRVSFADRPVLLRRLHGGNISLARGQGRENLLRIFKATIDRKREQAK